jgi:phosphohistidine swiveling domain-containing protein
VVAPIALTDPAARDPAAVGRKASLLAEAAAAGLPALPGAVLPLEASAGAIDAGVRALAEGGPAAAAYLAASAVDPPADAIASLAGVAPSVVVRSSTPYDDDGRWSGAFASYLDVGPGDLRVAVRGCWASAVSRDVLERCEATGVRPADVRVAVLVQPWVAFEVGGTARVTRDGAVRVSAAAAGPHGVVGGADATTVTLEPGAPSGDTVSDEAAALARRASEATGVATIEWGARAGAVTLLQVGPAPAAAPAGERPARRDAARGAVPPEAARVAALVAAHPGPLGEALVVPWALGSEAPRGVAPIVVEDPAAAFVEARRLAARLVGRVWGLDADAARSAAGETMRALRGGAIGRGVEAVRRLGAADPAEARRVVGLVAGVGEALATSGAIPAPELVWQLTVEEVEAALAGRRPTLRRGPDRWEPFLLEVAFARGAVAEGAAVAGGVGAGRLHLVPELRSIGRPGPRSVLAAPRPLPQLSPLLWRAAGLVTFGGSEGAHLFEVARSLGVPAVVGVGPEALGPAGSVVAVDADAGLVASLDADGPATGRRPA